MSSYKSQVNEKCFKSDDMTPENIAIALNSINNVLSRIETKIDNIEKNIIKDMKIWILSALVTVLGTGILIPIVVYFITKHF